ncbi:MAG TPA: PQQ-dependent sugar dehydrogenase [Tepidisphaeraceae bacterium]|nr:PQQ-dependent sugar dehydrogenase [Tepidisphaeraceae bacterium]
MNAAAGAANTEVSANAQVIRMLLPDFIVRELPVRLTNVNTLRFGPDGRLYVLGYDGRIHALRDTDGDGLEDEAEPYWDKPTLRVPVGMAFGADGALYVSSQAKVSVLRDKDGDGRADAEQILASGWPKTDAASGGVDATALTLDAQGNVYFGLLCANYANPYRVKDGRSQYDVGSERGTIQKMAADGSGRHTISTGIRVPYALAFNKTGDLFLTDQEGETWLPGGNPLDELNHIVPGKHYGFPPRHETYLPDIIDEPPVVGFGPQHQSTCGLVFNEPTKAQGLFGPPCWEGDALVAGFSRGKIWRTQLVKTPAGYVGRETLIASADMMVADLAISAKGDLYVACHSGQPDWGTGPKGQGKLFKISYADRGAAQPVAAWASGPEQVSITFDRPVSEAMAATPLDVSIEFGPHVRAADRYEVLRPGYTTVKEQQTVSRSRLAVRGQQWSPDRRTLLVATDPHPQRAHYAVTLTARRQQQGQDWERPIDLAYDMSGAQTQWTGERASEAGEATTRLPHLATDVSLALLSGSAQGQRLVEQLAQPGALKIQTLLDLPRDAQVVRLLANAPFTATAGQEQISSADDGEGGQVAVVPVAGGATPVPLAVVMKTGVGGRRASLSVAYSSKGDPSLRPVPLSRVVVPWAPPPTVTAVAPSTAPGAGDALLAGGNYERGRSLFNDQLKCATCHRQDKEARDLGPDLSNLAHKDAVTILRDIREPNATLNPDYVSYVVKLRDRRVLHGFVRAHGDEAIRVVATDHDTRVPRDQVLEMRTTGRSAMPDGLLSGMSAQQTADLLTFLMTQTGSGAVPGSAATQPASKPAAPPKGAEPPVRTPAEVRAVLGAGAAPPRGEKLRPLRITLVAGPKDHGPGEHDYPAWQKSWEQLLKGGEGLTISTAWQWPTVEQFEQADVLMFYFWNHQWTPERYEQLDAYLARGGGIVLLHAACIADADPESPPSGSVWRRSRSARSTATGRST